jgi:two-component system, NtrC family, response regulator PilR
MNSQRLDILRLLVICCSLSALAITFYSNNSFSQLEIYFLLLPILMLSLQLVTASILKGKSYNKFFDNYLIIVIDTFIITWLIYLSGVSSSPFTILYLIQVMYISSTKGRNLGIATTLCSTFSFITLFFLIDNKTLPQFHYLNHSEIVFGGIWLKTLGLVSAMSLISLLIDFLCKKIDNSKVQYEKSQKDLNLLRYRHACIFEGTPQPAITVDLEGKIVAINTSARVLLKLENKSYEGIHHSNVINNPFAQIAELICSPLDSRAEIEIQVNQESRNIVVFVKTLKAEDGANLGKVIFLEDLTDLRQAQAQLNAHRELAENLAKKEYGELINQSKNTPIEKYIVGNSTTVKRVFELIRRVADSPATVLVTGESGTGKELAARAIHASSCVAKGPFIAVNCGAIPESLIESELFGYVKGAFTGADRNHNGYFRDADNGTLFLDEVGELPLGVQAKLLRAIQEKTVRPLGSDQEYEINIRIISATHKNLRQEIIEGNFREDLYYRLNVVSLPLPPLRERREDIPLLVNHFLNNLVKDGSNLPVVDPEFTNTLMNYGYPGNIRELQNILEHAYVLGKTALLFDHLPEYIREVKDVSSKASDVNSKAASTETLIYEVDNLELPCDLDKILSNIEKGYLLQALSESGGAKRKAAEILGINMRTLRYRLQKHNLLIGR